MRQDTLHRYLINATNVSTYDRLRMHGQSGVKVDVLI